MKINTVEMHQFHKYAHGLHISISKKIKLNQFEKYNTDVLIHTQLEICENRFKLQVVNFLILAKFFTISNSNELILHLSFL